MHTSFLVSTMYGGEGKIIVAHMSFCFVSFPFHSISLYWTLFISVARFSFALNTPEERRTRTSSGEHILDQCLVISLFLVNISDYLLPSFASFFTHRANNFSRFHYLSNLHTTWSGDVLQSTHNVPHTLTRNITCRKYLHETAQQRFVGGSLQQVLVACVVPITARRLVVVSE